MHAIDESYIQNYRHTIHTMHFTRVKRLLSMTAATRGYQHIDMWVKAKYVQC